ncbi:G5 domain-containing protein [Catelliglobosispora koreensis]|uniref:G5 domain-containing protein n=1 Tax=Catelliglobosispora koreensis TaxID=129052 RepID=UPI00036C8ACC|nr:G5 domain-containing protein [Catelliglobosispora koreensis]
MHIPHKGMWIAAFLAVAAGCAVGDVGAPSKPVPSSVPTSNSPSPTPTPVLLAPVMRHTIESSTAEIPFRQETRQDSSVDEGTKYVAREGIPGSRTRVYEVVTRDGTLIERRLVAEFATEPTAEVTVIGTRQSRPTCDPNYSGCVPIASDVDCQGGRGNGPAYVRGPVRVVGSDIYGLDGDNDGIGCE